MAAVSLVKLSGTKAVKTTAFVFNNLFVTRDKASRFWCFIFAYRVNLHSFLYRCHRDKSYFIFCVGIQKIFIARVLLVIN
jgi:hypothetical protein